MSWEAWGDPPDVYCEMCGCEAGSCICPECPVCDEAGNPSCYKEHGMVESDDQIDSRIRHSPDDPTDYYFD